MLVIGYGNPGRGDDGLGPAFADRIASAGLAGVEVSKDYQLTVDHALPVSRADSVVFADALMRSDAPFAFGVAAASAKADLSSHSLAPAAILALAETLYGAVPRAYVLGIAGHAFGEVKEGLSPAAAENLARAVDFFVEWAGGDATGGDVLGCVDA